MSKESRIFSPTVWNVQETVTHYESFGWELLSINGNQIVMSRETQNPVYSELVKYQAIYEELAEKYAGIQPPMQPSAPEPVNYKIAVIGFICFIVPGVIYVAYRAKKKKAYNLALEKYNQKCVAYQNKRQEILEKMKKTVLDSRAVFFSRQG